MYQNYSDNQKVFAAKAVVVFICILIGFGVYQCSNPCHDFYTYNWKQGNYKTVKIESIQDSISFEIIDSNQIATLVSSFQASFFAPRNSTLRGQPIFKVTFNFENQNFEEFRFNKVYGSQILFRGDCSILTNDSLVNTIYQLVELEKSEMLNLNKVNE